MSWDYTVDMLGSLTVYWAVLRDGEGIVEVWQSPYLDLPPEDPSEHETRQGLTTSMMRPLTSYTDSDLGVAAHAMVGLSSEDFIHGHLTNRIFWAIKEQRDREGGYVPAKTEPEEG